MKDKLKKTVKRLLPHYQTLIPEYPYDLKPKESYQLNGHPLLNSILMGHEPIYQPIIDQIILHRDTFNQIPYLSENHFPQEPCWNNGFLPGLDIAALYTLIGMYQPKRYFEIGSGNSTKVARRAVNDFGLKTHIHSIDPAPRAEIDGLVNSLDREAFEKTDLNWINQIQPNDIVFVDNSHRVLPNSDATTFFMDVLPSLPHGTLVQIHDVYLPYDYPQDMCDRFYSEQYALAFFLLANPRQYRPLFPAYYISQAPHLNYKLNEMWDYDRLKKVERHGGSFWLQIHR